MKIVPFVVLVLCLMVTGTAMASTTDCSAGVTTNMAEPSLLLPEASITATCTGFMFPFAQTETAVFFDPNSTLPSDIVTLANVSGAATITFVSDTELALGLPTGSFITVHEPNHFVVIALSTTGGANSELTFASDDGSSVCGANSDCITASATTATATPEPATLTLLGIALFGGGVMRRRFRSGSAVGEK